MTDTSNIQEEIITTQISTVEKSNNDMPTLAPPKQLEMVEKEDCMSECSENKIPNNTETLSDIAEPTNVDIMKKTRTTYEKKIKNIKEIIGSIIQRNLKQN